MPPIRSVGQYLCSPVCVCLYVCTGDGDGKGSAEQETSPLVPSLVPGPV